MRTLITSVSLIFALLCAPTNLVAADIDFNLLGSSPEGSWQVREDIETDSKGRRSGITSKTSMLSSEIRDGEKHYWIEMVLEPFKISKKGQRKQNGDKLVIKSLLPESTLQADPANVLSNLRGLGVETIFQNGNDAPMRMGSTDGMMAGMMKSFNTEIEYDFEPLGQEQVTVQAGDFATKKIRGTGSVSMKVVFKKINVESENTVWISSKVPFGTVKVEGTSTTNGKQSTNSSELLEYGMSGAVSQITQEPTDMPEMPKLGDLFGG